MKTKWVYKLERVSPPAFARAQALDELIEETLNRRGLDGWELVNALETPLSGAVSLYFKRPF